MALSDLFAGFDRPHPEDRLTQLSTVWGEKLEPSQVLAEYPRPRFVRGSHINLNGVWRYAITKTPEEPQIPDGTILVPFSPESLLSGVGRTLMPDEYLWYFKTLPELKAPSADARLLLHFGAVDQVAEVYVNGAYQCTHVGGYLPFTVDITDALRSESEKEIGETDRLMVRVTDSTDTGWHARGKQALSRGGSSYSAQSGIWQSVWMEWVPKCYIRSMEVTPHDDLYSVTVRLETNRPSSVEIVLYDGENRPFTRAYCSTASSPGEEYPLELCKSGSDTKPCNLVGSGSFTASVRLLIDNAHLWTPDDPYLYHMSLRVGEDTVVTYFGMRCFSVREDAQGVGRFHLNHEPLFLNGVLDQGYWPDGLMTAPSDKALLYDIAQMKRLGFNLMRKHLKVESARWYYHCDRLGMLVLQDIVNGGSAPSRLLTKVLPPLFPRLFGACRDTGPGVRMTGRSDREGCEQWENEMRGTIGHLYSVPSVCCWSLFHEGQGQFEAEKMTQGAKQADPTRPVDQASGWFDRGGGDFRSIHLRSRKPFAEKDRHGRALLLSEYGGYALRVEQHCATPRTYGFRRFSSMAGLNEAWKSLMTETVKKLEKEGLGGAVYAQVSDIEDELNGVMTYDRKIIKIAPVE